MSEESVDDDGQFEQVLSRLDALMKRSHEPVVQPPIPPSPVDDMPFQIVSGGDDPGDASGDIPILTEVYQGAALIPVLVDAAEEVPVLTEALPVPSAGQDERVQEVDLMQRADPEPPEVSLEAQVDAVMIELMPLVRAMMARVVQEEVMQMQQVLQARLVGEAEQVLRQRLMEGVKPK